MSTFTAPINVLVDLLFEDILMAPSSERNNQSRNVAKVAPIMNSSIKARNPRNTALLKSVSSKLLLSDERQKMDIPEETAAAHGRATVLVSRKLSKVVASRRNIDASTSGTNIDDSAEQLFHKLISKLEHQRKILNRRQQIAFDNLWRYRHMLLVLSPSDVDV